MTDLGVADQLVEHPEFMAVSVGEPVCQGDIFEWREPDDDPWHSFGVIVTADCDLHQRKHRGILSYVPILSLEHFLAEHWMSDQVERRLRNPLESAASQIRRIVATTASLAGESDYNLRDWLMRDGSDGVLKELGGVPRDQLTKLRETLDLCAMLLRTAAIRQLTTALEELIHIVARIKRVDMREVETDLWSQLQGFVQRLPGDCFFLSALSAFHPGGFVAYLRRVQEVQAKQFAGSTLDFEAAAVIRLSRLRPAYKYRLTQMLAAVFADIGLPEQYSEGCREAVMRLRTGKSAEKVGS